MPPVVVLPFSGLSASLDAAVRFVSGPRFWGSQDNLLTGSELLMKSIWITYPAGMQLQLGSNWHVKKCRSKLAFISYPSQSSFWKERALKNKMQGQVLQLVLISSNDFAAVKAKLMRIASRRGRGAHPDVKERLYWSGFVCISFGKAKLLFDFLS